MSTLYEVFIDTNDQSIFLFFLLVYMSFLYTQNLVNFPHAKNNQ